MSWLKKTFKKAFKKPSFKSLKNVLQGRPHMRSNFKRINKFLPKFARLRSWGQLKKSHKLGLSHILSNSVGASPGFYSMGYSPSNGYVYQGRTLSEMM